jgi:CHAT domain-containing protein
MALRNRIREGGELFRSGEYTKASHVFELVLQSAQHSGLVREAGRALGNLGGCQFALHNYRGALKSFIEARGVSESVHDAGAIAAWEANIASLYSEMGEFDAAAEWIEHSIERMPGRDRAQQLPKLQLEMATLRARQGRMPEAAKLFGEGIRGADRAADLELYAIGWNGFGEALLNQGNVAGAEGALLEAYRIRKLHHLPLDTSYSDLGRLKLAQGDLASASVLLDRAVELAAHPRSLAPTWDIYHWRGLVRLAQGRTADALSDLRIALRLGRAWRWSAPSNDTTRVSAEGMLDQVHSALVEAGNRLYFENHDRALIRETFTANEENRAASLRVFTEAGPDANSELPGAYWEALARFQRAEVDGLQNGASTKLASARAELIRIEASLGSGLRPLPKDLPDTFSRELPSNTTLFSFHLDPNASWLWALNRDGMELYELPNRAEIERQVRAVTAAIRDQKPEAASLSACLYATLFGKVARRYSKAPRWLLALDTPLFDLPISALAESVEPEPVYLVERHTIEMIPGVAYWLDSAAQPAPQLSNLFVGLGDPIYNRADSRWTPTAHPRTESLSLPRLVGSGAEVEACARAWQGPSVLLRGDEASREKLIEQLQRRPAVVHLAAHFLESTARTRYGLIALSLSPKGDAELLTPFEISRWHIRIGVVVLSGCHSAVGVPLPGEGLMGLTRAWLAAGAQGVVGSFWDTPDDTGPLFAALYRNLHAEGKLDAGRALHDAQLEMLRAGGRSSAPAYWGAYFAVANQRKVIPR